MTAADAPAVAGAEDVPRRLGAYELLTRIGSGGVSTVFLARRGVVDGVYREVALKLLQPGAGTDHGDAAQLLDEARVAARIRHPNVVPVLELGTDAGQVFLVMEYVEGDSLHGLLHHARQQGAEIPLPIAGRILVDALAGLHAAHELCDDGGEPLRLVHRDFTPHNVLVGTDGVTRLTDFGIAKTADARGLTATGLIKGKVAYMSPEQALGHPLDRRCDVWAAGVVAWELLTGARMFEGDNDAVVLLRVLREDAPRASSRRRGLPSEVDLAVAAALEREIDRRLPSADAFRERILAAWRLTDGLAEPAEVGAYVTRIAEGRLERLRQRAQASARLIGLAGAHAAAAPRRTSRVRGALWLAGTASLAAVVSWTVARATGPDRDNAAPVAESSAVPALVSAPAEQAAPVDPEPSAEPSPAAEASGSASPAASDRAADAPRAPATPAHRPRKKSPLPGLAPPAY